MKTQVVDHKNLKIRSVAGTHRCADSCLSCRALFFRLFFVVSMAALFMTSFFHRRRGARSTPTRMSHLTTCRYVVAVYVAHHGMRRGSARQFILSSDSEQTVYDSVVAWKRCGCLAGYEKKAFVMGIRLERLQASSGYRAFARP